MKLLKRALLLMITAAVYGLRSYANARRNATAADSPALRAQTSASPHRLEWAGHAHVPAACGGVMAERGIAAEPAPEIILADEPTAALDSVRALTVVKILNQLAQEFRIAIIVVTHDEKIIPTFKRIYHIRDGKTYEEAGEGRPL